MKHSIFLLVLMAIAPKAFSQDIYISADATTGQTLYYHLLNHTAYVVSPASVYLGDSNYVSGDLIIPDTVFYEGEAYPVVEIWACAFRGCRDLTSVVIGHHTIRIGNNAFLDCSSMRKVTLPASLRRIESATFASCASLDSVVIPNLITIIEPYTFSECSSLTHIDLNNVTEIQAGAFRGCSSLASLTIPTNQCYIGIHTFDGCSSLTSIDIPNSVRSIGDWSFYGCTGLTSVVIPDSVNNIGMLAFGGCNILTVYLRPLVPPFSGTYYTFPAHSTLVVPHDSYDDYLAWIEDLYFSLYSDTITITLNDRKKGDWGYVVGADTAYAYPYDTIRLEAVANPGYEFVGWENGETDPVRLVTGLHRSTSIMAQFAVASTAGIEDIASEGISVTATDGHIVVSGADDEVAIYDICGRQVARSKGSNLDFNVPHTGIYILKIGSRPASKIAVF